MRMILKRPTKNITIRLSMKLKIRLSAVLTFVAVKFLALWIVLPWVAKLRMISKKTPDMIDLNLRILNWIYRMIFVLMKNLNFERYTPFSHTPTAFYS